jgi:3-phosphoshikimate 1-carboxyvinyltransferase
LINPASGIRGGVILSGDKSIAHRAVIASALSKGKTKIYNFPRNRDCLFTVNAFKKLGIKFRWESLQEYSGTLIVEGRGLFGLQRPKGDIFVGESGTTLRLLLGVLASQGFRVRLSAARSLLNRPMRRVNFPLRKMGAQIIAKRAGKGLKAEEYPPLVIRGGRLRPISYVMPIASAQVKSAILLAGLFTKGTTAVVEPLPTRDHTERMLKIYKADVKVHGNKVVIKGDKDLVSPGRINIPGDISSAAFFVALGAITPGSRLCIRNVGLNYSRAGIIRTLKKMGAKIKVLRHKQASLCLEPLGDIIIKTSRLKGIIVEKDQIPSLIDELPILMVVAAVARGKTVLRGVGELRFKETDRIRSMAENLKKMGADITVKKKGQLETIEIRGIDVLKGARLRSFGDHRTAMSLIIAALAAKGRSSLDEIDCINKSFPGFTAALSSVVG